MRWYVDISSIATKGPTSRYCVEAEQWQKALQTVRTQRGDDASFGNFSIELLDDGYRAIDPLTRTRYVVQRAPDGAPLTSGDAVTLAQEELTKVEGKPASRSSAARNEVPPARGSRRGGRASDRGRASRAGGRGPSIPDDPVPRSPSSPPSKLAADTTLASGTPLFAEASRTNGAGSHTDKATASSAPPAPRPIPRTPDVPIIPPARPMQAETAFERMTGGSAVSLPAKIPASAEVQTEVLPAFKVLSRRSEDPTASSPLTYREMALAVAATTTLRDAEAIARAQFEVIRNAIAGAPKGKFIQLAIFDHEFAGKPAKAPIVTLAFKDWRNPEPDLRFPQRDGPGPASVRSAAISAPPAAAPLATPPPSAPPAPPVPAGLTTSGAPSMGAPSTVEAPTMPILGETVVKTVVPTSMARPSIDPVTTPEPAVPDPAPPEPPADSDVIKPAPIIAIVASTPEDDIPISGEPAAEAAAPAPVAAEPIVPAPIVAAPAEDSAPPTVPSEPPPAPTSSEIRARASEMADDQEKTLVKPSNPPPPPEPARPASIPPAAQAQQANEHVVSKTTKMAAVQHPSAPPPAQQPSAPPPARSPSAPPPAQQPSAPPPGSQAQPALHVPAAPKVPSAPPAGPPLLVRRPMGARRSGDDLITDLFEACSDLDFLGDTLDGAEFVLALILDSIPSTIALCSFFDINTRELVVVRQGVTPDFSSLPNALGTRASEFAPLIARSMRAGRSLVLGGDDLSSLGEDPRWRLLGVSPKSVITTGVVASGRYLGLIEVADPIDGLPFTESDGHALTYIGQQFSEYLAQREIDLSSERIVRPKLAQARRN